MPLSRNINTYGDVAAVLAEAKQAGGARYTPVTAPARWAQRAYTYRKLLSERLGPGTSAPTIWDDMTLRIDGKTVIIEFGVVQGKLEPLNAETDITPKARLKTETANLDPLLADALRLAEDKGE